MSECFGDELASGCCIEFFVQVFDMVVDSVGASVEDICDHANRVTQDKLIEDDFLTVSEPCFGVGNLGKCGVCFHREYGHYMGHVCDQIIADF